MLPRLDLKVGFACNNSCRFCVQGDKRRRLAERPAAEVRDALRDGRSRAEAVVFTGGEPTIRKDLPELVSFARDLGYRIIQIQTNGRMLAYRSYVELLVAAGANEFSPAVHGHTAALHDGLTRVPGSFDQTLSGIRNLQALGQYVLTNTVVTRRNYEFLPRIAHLLVSLGVDQFQLAFVHPVGRAGEHFESVVPRMEKAAPRIRDGLRVGLDAGLRVMAEAVPYCLLEGFEQCVAERYIPETAVVDVDGVVSDYTRYRQVEGKAKGPDCRKCVHDWECEGPWREYPARFGWSELRPVLAG